MFSPKLFRLTFLVYFPKPFDWLKRFKESNGDRSRDLWWSDQCQQLCQSFLKVLLHSITSYGLSQIIVIIDANSLLWSFNYHLNVMLCHDILCYVIHWHWTLSKCSTVKACFVYLQLFAYHSNISQTIVLWSIM
jgi:hypothetical protein